MEYLNQKSLLKMLKKQFGNKQFSFKTTLKYIKKHFETFFNPRKVIAVLIALEKSKSIVKIKPGKFKVAGGD